ncbi:MAG: TonB-dependent receptor, partial [Bacteroidales bacterium]|nr:TonB-dependent receptor [Bacteroidales bacterium]
WKHTFRKNYAWNTALSRTKYVFDLTGSQNEYYFNLFSSVEDYNLRSDLTFNAGIHSLVTGFELTEHRFVPNKIDARANEFLLNFGQFNNLYALEGGLYIDDEFPITGKLSFAGGIRFSFFNHHGPFRKFVRDPFDQVTDTLFYSGSQSLAFYFYPEPRTVLKYQVNESSSFKASYMRIAQYVHLATSASVSMPTDIWIPSTDYIKPMIGNQLSLGYFRDIRGQDYVFSTEVYYKSMRNKLEFLRGIVYNSIYGNLEENLASGTGRSYGVEIYIRQEP